MSSSHHELHWNAAVSYTHLVAYIFLFFLFNIFSAKGGGYFQNASTVIKLIPLIVIALIGLIFGNVSSVSMNVSEMFSNGTSWIAAIGPIAFAFDGWVISTTISQEVKNAEKNLSIALIAVSYTHLDVLMSISDRLLVLHDGKIMDIVDPKQVSKEDVGLLMMGHLIGEELTC